MRRPAIGLDRVGWATVIVAVVIAGSVVSRWTPSVPEDAASAVVARTVLQGDLAPDPTEGTDPGSLGRTPAGSECLDTIERPAGPMSLCWTAFRDPFDADPTQDLYQLQVTGTFGGESGTGVRWAVVRARLVEKPSNQVFDAWPIGTFDSPCQQVDVSFGSASSTPEMLCPRTTGTSNHDDWSHRVVWTCVSCLIPDHADRSIALFERVAVPEGTIPTWEIFADLGS